MLDSYLSIDGLLLSAAFFIDLLLLLRIRSKSRSSGGEVFNKHKHTEPPSITKESSASMALDEAVEVKTPTLRMKAYNPQPQFESGDVPISEEKITPAPIEQIPPEKNHSRVNFFSATSSRLLSGVRAIFASSSVAVEETIYRELEKSLIEGDVGVVATEKLLSDLKNTKRDTPLILPAVEEELKARMIKVFDSNDGASISLTAKPTVLVIVGINGVGKTTTAGKIAKKYAKDGKKVLLGACDTFRAAAVSQLQIWGERSGVEVIFGAENSKPATVAYTACKKAESEEADLLILDTAGRLHNKKNLMDELGGVLKIISRELPGAPHEVLLVVDSTSGQNALEQARSFKEVCNITGIVVTKLDGSPRGGMLFAIRSELGIPVRYIGLGEGVDDLKLFKPSWFVEELFQ